MLCVLQIGLCVLGVMVMRKKKIRVGRQFAKGRAPFLVGLPLVAQLPLAIVISALFGLATGIDAARQAQSESQSRGQSDSQTQAQVEAVVQKRLIEFQDQYWWLDLIVPCCGVLASGLILGLRLADVEPKASDDPLSLHGRARYGTTGDNHNSLSPRQRYDG